ncbi:MAG: ATP-binding protein [Sarcina sp.]
MIKGYQSELLDLYEKIRTEEKEKLKNRVAEINAKYPKILDLDREIGKISVKLSLTVLKKSDNKTEEIQQLRDLMENLRAQKYEMLVKEGYPQNYLNLNYKCRKCKDTGFIGINKCSCFNQKLIELYYKNSHLQEALKQNNFNLFDINYYSNLKRPEERFSPRENMEKILDKLITDYIPNFKNSNENILFYGNSGTGKTFLSCCISKELLDKGFLVVYRTSDELVRNLREIRFDNNKYLEDLLINCDLLVIDDLGAEQPTEFSITELFTLLNKKLLLNKKMIISSNLNISELTARYAERITSRLFGNFTLFKIYGDDIRVRKNLNRLK